MKTTDTGSQEKPYGFTVTYEHRTAIGFSTSTFRRKGTEAAARRAAIMKRGYVRVISVDPYTHQEWLRAFGEGRM